MTDSIEAGSDDDAIAGEQVGYVPCFGAAAAVDADDDSEAIDGRGEGYVADGTGAGDFADSDDGQAVYGSAVGFVAKPCGSDVPCLGDLPPDYTAYEEWWRYDTPAAGAWDNLTTDWGPFDLVADEQPSIPGDPPNQNYVVFFRTLVVPDGATGVTLTFNLDLGGDTGGYAFPLASAWAIHLANWGDGPPTVFSDPQTLPDSTIIASSDTVDPTDLFPVVTVTIGISGPLQLFMTGTAYEGAAVWLGPGPDPGTFPEIYHTMRVNAQSPIETEWLYGTPCGCTDGIIDDAERTEVFAPFNAWGRTTPDSYGVWNTGSPTGSSSFSVNGHQLVAVGGHATPLGSPRGITAVLTGSFPTGDWPWQDGDFTARVRFQLDDNGTGSPDIIFDFGTTQPVRMYLQHGTGTVKIGIFRSAFGVADEVAVAIPTLNTDYIFETKYKQSTGVHLGRMFLYGDTPPAWQLSRDSSGDPATVNSGMRVVVDPASGSPDVTYLIEDITYDICP